MELDRARAFVDADRELGEMNGRRGEGWDWGCEDWLWAWETEWSSEDGKPREGPREGNGKGKVERVVEEGGFMLGRFPSGVRRPDACWRLRRRACC